LNQASATFRLLACALPIELYRANQLWLSSITVQS